MQSFSIHSQFSVGHQHKEVQKGTLYALQQIYKQFGIRGLWRGVDASMIRTGIGSAVQLSSYDGCKSMLLSIGIFQQNSKIQNESWIIHFCASWITSLLVCIAMNPFDVASTRMVTL